jgi:hypothetical protein
MSEIDLYYGAASGQQRSALQRLDPGGVMISHATANNTPWAGNYDLFVDSGGYHHMITGDGEYEDSDEVYLQYLLKHRPHLYALRDYPCEPELLDTVGRCIREQQQRTTDHHAALLDAVSGHSLADSAVSVLQGWTEGDYLRHLDALRERGCLTSHVAIGSVCRRGYDHEIASIVLRLRDELPPKHTLHAFGVKAGVLRFEEVVDALDSVDSAAYDYAESRVPAKRDTESFTWRDSARAYLNWRHKLLSQLASEPLTGSVRQQQLTEEVSLDV